MSNVNILNAAKDGWVTRGPLLFDGEKRISIPAGSTIDQLKCTWEDGDNINKVFFSVKYDNEPNWDVVFSRQVRSSTQDYLFLRLKPFKRDCLLEVRFSGWALNPKISLVYTLGKL